MYAFLLSKGGEGVLRRIANQDSHDVKKTGLTDIVTPITGTGEASKQSSEGSNIPPFEPSKLALSNVEKSTFAHQGSGLLFADEIKLLDEKEPAKTTRKIIEPSIHRDFTLDSLPRQFRNRTWDLTVRLRVSRSGDPIGNIKIIKSSGDKVLDQLTLNRLKGSHFEPAHFEGSSTYFDYLFDMKIRYR